MDEEQLAVALINSIKRQTEAVELLVSEVGDLSLEVGKLTSRLSEMKPCLHPSE